MNYYLNNTEFEFTNNIHSLQNDTGITPSGTSYSNLSLNELDSDKANIHQSSNSSSSDNTTTLEHLQDPEPGGKLKYTYHKLIQYIIQGSPSGRLRLDDIVGAITTKFFLRYNTFEKQKRLRNTIRHHLSLYPKFVLDGKLEGAPGKAQLWTIDSLALNDPPKSKPKKGRTKMATSNTSGSAGPTRTSGRKRADQVSNSHPNRSSRHRRTNPQLAVQEPPSPKNVPGSTTSPQHQLTPEPFSSFLISPQHTQSSVSPAATQSLPVTPLFQLEPSPSPFHPDITVDSELLGGHGIRLSTRSSIAFPISSDPTQVATLPPKVAQSLPATPLFPSDQSCSALQPLITMESTQTYPTSNLTAQHATSQAVFSVPQPNMPHSHSAYLFQPFGIPPLSSSSLNNTPPSIIPYASTSSSYVGFGQAVQEPTFSLLQYGLGSVANTPLEFSFDQSGGDAGMSLTGGMSPFYGTSTRKSF